MCDNYSRKYGYLCNDCLRELISKGIKQDIREFMESDKEEVNEKASFAYFSEIFKRE